ncbi:ABC transporter ATP-binding protein [Hazenella coriacea]|uniref:ABC-2 type transport system ATP-binding protein n=1 Tax=Hazenella coriacea TaxID=1179467 RepID=A0A4R3LGZ3_9BACL|nr:ABC transporter ATP-binding protein [Hazenella coriacea]TCS96786.1 ABC-2 type transport system ATP-binding protein [Hazenella coriacea]
MIQIQGVSKQYRRNEWALRNIKLTIDKGMFGLLGPNGAGKTTLMRIMATLLKPTSGNIQYDQYSLNEADQIRKMIGYLPQSFQVYPQLTGYEFLDYVAVMKGLETGRKRKQVIELMLEEVNLTDQANKKVKTYSGGMRRRLGIAQALLGGPQVLIVDEPTAGLDPEERVRFRNLLSRFSLQRTVILSTHIVGDIESTCEQMAVLKNGQVVIKGHLDLLQEEAVGKVWEVVVSEREFATIPGNKIITSRKMSEGIYCKVISDHPLTKDAVLVQEPTLEDGYLALLGGGSHG